jgi:hypothetical protein
MLPSARLGLLALLRCIQSIGSTLKSFLLRYVLRNLRHIWLLCCRTSPKDVSKKKEGQARPSFHGASGGCEGYSVICASRDFNRGSEPHLLLPTGPGNAEVLPLSPIMGQPQSAPCSPALSLASSLPRSPQHSDRQLPEGSTTSIPRSYNADIQLPIRHLTLTHSRTTSIQFTGAPPGRPRSPSPSPSPSLSPYPHPHHLSQSSTLESPVASPGHSRSPSPSPYPFPQPRPLPQPSVLDSSDGTQLSDGVPNPHEGYGRPGIMISPPSRSQTAKLPVDSDGQSTFNFPQSPLSFQQDFQGLPQFPTAGAEHSVPDPSNPGGFRLTHGNPRHSSGSLRDGTLPGLPLSSDPARDQFSYPRPFTSQVSVGNIPVVDASGIWSDGKTRIIGLMHSEQVSRYVNKGDV